MELKKIKCNLSIYTCYFFGGLLLTGAHIFWHSDSELAYINFTLAILLFWFAGEYKRSDTTNEQEQDKEKSNE